MMQQRAGPQQNPGDRTGRWILRASVAALLIASAVLGGGGREFPFPAAALQLFAAIIAAIWFGGRGFSRSHPVPRRAWIVVVLLIAGPIVQLVPLPPAIWQALPGRELEVRALNLVGGADDWRAWTISPVRTCAALLALGPPALVLVLVAALPKRDRSVVAVAILAAALVSLVLGAGQLAGNSGNALRFYSAQSHWLHGFQANHNSQADVLLIAFLALAWLTGEALQRHSQFQAHALAAYLGIGALLISSLILTGSRTGLALLPLAIVIGAAMIWPALRYSRKVAGALGAVAALILAVALSLTREKASSALRRLDFTGERRPEIWADSWNVVGHYWPAGAGVGAFVPAFAPFERREALYIFPLQYAHNEYLEMMIEMGIFAPLIWAVLLGILLFGGRQHWRKDRRSSAYPTYFAAGAGGIIALHAVVDYPLRSMSLACFAAAGAGLLAARRT